MKNALRKIKENIGHFWISFPYIWLILFLFLPLLLIVYLSFSESRWDVLPYKSWVSWTENSVLNIRVLLSNYKDFFRNSLYVWSYFQGAIIAAITTFFCALVGYPMAYYIYSSPQKRRFFLLFLSLMPFWTSFLLRVYGWINLLSFNGMINQYLLSFGIIEKPIIMLKTYPCVILGMVYCYLPFMILPIYLALERIDQSLLEAAYDLRCSPLGIFWQIIFPLSSPGIVVGSSLVFLPSVGEYVIPELLGGSELLVIGKIIWEEFFTNIDWPTASALAVLMIGFLSVPIFIFNRLQRYLRRRYPI